jgi:CheY-like chemotaxis protein
MRPADGQKLVLVAEDADPDFFLLNRAFRSAGFSHRLVHVRSGSDAIKYLKRESPFQDADDYPAPDLVVLDANMPQGAGVDVLNYLRESGCTVPAVILSGSALPREMEEALSRGAAECLRKPAEPSELLVVAQTLHHRWLSKRRT